MSPTAVAGSPVAGLIYETWHSYDYAFYLGGLTCVIGAFFMSGTIILINFYKRISRFESSFNFFIYFNQD